MKEAAVGAGAPYVHPFMLAMKQHLIGLSCLLFSSGFWFTPSCGSTKYNWFQSFTKIDISCSSWYCLLKKPAGLHRASRQSLWAWGQYGNTRGQRCCSWHLTLSHHFTFCKGSVIILLILSWADLLLEESTYCLGESSCITFLCSRNDLVVTSGCLKLSVRSLGNTWDTAHGDKLLCYFVEGNIYLSSSHFWAEWCQSRAGTQVLLVPPVGKHSCLRTASVSFSDGEKWSLSTAWWLLERQQAREKITGFCVRGEVLVFLL